MLGLSAETSEQQHEYVGRVDIRLSYRQCAVLIDLEWIRTAEGLKPERFHFSAPFGRSLEYYTGFVFQIEALTKDGAVQVAGGGRYDDLLSDIGSPVKVPAVGCAIDTGRLLAAVSART